MCSSGIAATAPALASRRQRSHSEIEPIDDYAAEESGEDDRQEVEEHDEAVSVALPVVVRTNHGIAICVAELPLSEIASAA